MAELNLKISTVFSRTIPAALTLTAILASPAQAAGYNIKFLGTLNDSPLEAYASSINIREDVAGNSCGSPDGCGGYRPTLWPRGNAPRELKLFGIDHSVYKINDRGEMIGSADTPTGLTGAYWTRHSGELLQPTGRGYRSSPSAINNLGVIVGSYWSPEGARSPVIWINKIPRSPKSVGPNADFTAINDKNQIAGTVFDEIPYAVRWDGLRPKYLPSGSNAFPFDINNRGQIVGYSVISGNSFATLWSWGSVAYLPTLEGNSAAVDINNLGVIVGSSNSRAVMWKRNLQIVDLNDYLSAEQKTAGIVLLDATGINDDGAITGNALVPSAAVGQVRRPYLLTPR